jgi:hypothetical protein
MYSHVRQANLFSEEHTGETENLIQLFPLDYQQAGFINANNVKYTYENEVALLKAAPTDTQMFQHSSQYVFNEWRRNKSINTIGRCLLI